MSDTCGGNLEVDSTTTYASVVSKFTATTDDDDDGEVAAAGGLNNNESENTNYYHWSVNNENNHDKAVDTLFHEHMKQRDNSSRRPWKEQNNSESRRNSNSIVFQPPPERNVVYTSAGDYSNYPSYGQLDPRGVPIHQVNRQLFEPRAIRGSHFKYVQPSQASRFPLVQQKQMATQHNQNYGSSFMQTYSPILNHQPQQQQQSFNHRLHRPVGYYTSPSFTFKAQNFIQHSNTLVRPFTMAPVDQIQSVYHSATFTPQASLFMHGFQQPGYDTNGYDTNCITNQEQERLNSCVQAALNMTNLGKSS